MAGCRSLPTVVSSQGLCSEAIGLGRIFVASRMTTRDEAKRRRDIAEHGVDLALAQDFEHEAALVDVDRSGAYGEHRFRALGPIGNELVAPVYALNEDGTDDRAAPWDWLSGEAGERSIHSVLTKKQKGYFIPP